MTRSAPAAEQAVAILNGLVGDYLVQRGNGLATPFAAIVDGAPIGTDRAALAAAFPKARGRVILLLHGLMCTETVWTYQTGISGEPGEESTDYGRNFARDFDATPIYLRFNTGLSIPENGALFSAFLTELLENFPTPIEEIVLLGFSMGGLVIRAACHTESCNPHASAASWLTKVRDVFYLGTPHRGAPLERLGRIAARVLGQIPDPYTRLAATLADLRSNGIKGLGDADLTTDDCSREKRLSLLENPEHPIPLLPSLRHHFVAGAFSTDPLLAQFLGDAMVPLTSAANTHEFVLARRSAESENKFVSARRGAGSENKYADTANIRVFHQRHNGRRMVHMELAHDPQVYAQIHAWYTKHTNAR